MKSKKAKTERDIRKAHFYGNGWKKFSVLFINSYVTLTQTHLYKNLKPGRPDFHHTNIHSVKRKFHSIVK